MFNKQKKAITVLCQGSKLHPLQMHLQLNFSLLLNEYMYCCMYLIIKSKRLVHLFKNIQQKNYSPSYNSDYNVDQ